jgi:hypothetical protein
MRFGEEEMAALSDVDAKKLHDGLRMVLGVLIGT